MTTDLETMHHVARLAFLAMAARGVAADEFQKEPTLQKVVITLSNPFTDALVEIPLDIEYIEAGFPVGGMSL